MKNKIYIILIILLIPMSIVAIAGAKEVNVYVDNDKVLFDQQPILHNNKIIIPFRQVLESLGYKVWYNEKTSTAIAEAQDELIELPINSNKVIKNGKVSILQETTQILNDRIMVTEDFFKELIGCEVKEINGPGNITIYINRKIDLSKYFKGYKATFKLYDLKNKKSFVYNEEDLERRTPPASTYKIMNSLIALQTKVVDDENTAKKWDGKEYPVPAWNKDHTLSSAIKDSVVWYYQAVARDIGKERMQEYINKVHYGNQVIGEKIDAFWLDGSLQISPNEQLDIVKKLYNEELPFDKDVIKTVKRILINEETEETILAGKTGTYVDKGGAKAGWYVGYVISDSTPYVFVTRLEEPEAGESQPIAGWKAKLITKDILKELNILE